ncbi:MAG: ADP-ribosylglycohydrolase family protein [Muribaculaceae bacterium]|nr:ADP-ribosylglycohydrolase family protein [Muribaculaceae bacterium]
MITDQLKRLSKAKLVLRGAVCGDILGSWYEFRSTKSLDCDLFVPYSRFTDDTVCSIAVSNALINGCNFTRSLQNWCIKYPRAGYGGNFNWWFRQVNPEPYNSWGNGSAMRVSSVGAFAISVDEVMDLAARSAEVSHNHPEGIKGAQATALAIYLALNGASKEEIKAEIEQRFDYDLSRNYYDIQSTYFFEVSCQKSVPEAIISFLVSDSYESAIRHAVALGGDADTQAAIAGGIAAAYYGEIPDSIMSFCWDRLTDDIKETICQFDLALDKKYGE